MPDINEMILKLECFHYSMSLYLNLGYYHIQLSEKLKELVYDYSLLGKYCYKRLPTRVDNSPDNHPQKMNDLFHGF